MMDTETLELLRESLRAVLSGETSRPHARDLAELGWDEVLDEDEAAATCCLFELHGELLAESSLLDDVAIRALRITHPAVVIWPYPSTAISATDRSDGTIDVRGLARGYPEAADAAHAVVVTGAGVGLVGNDALGWQRVRGVDPAGDWWLVTGERCVVDVLSGEWGTARSAAQRAIASELIGLSGAILAMAQGHVTSREQFGRTIGSFQAVRHRLAEAYAFLEGARAVIDAAWADGSPAASSIAKAVAGRAHADVARHALQVCGAMGLSWEFPLHRFVGRGYALDALLGSGRELGRGHGLELLELGRLPRVGSPAVTA